MSTSKDVLVELTKYGLLVAAAGIIYFYTPAILEALNGDMPVSKKVKKSLATRLNRPEIETMDFCRHEITFAADIITCGEIDVTFSDIGGMDDKVDEVKDNIVLPLEMWTILRGKSNLTPCPTGVLLYGKPGTGKTMTAKAIAKEAGATFINVKTSTLIDKYVGETDKLVHGLFCLARKLAPSIIFIDEIDTLLSSRGGGNLGTKIYDTMQGIFLQEWDGLNTSAGAYGPVIVLGATNRPNDIDKSFLRRMPFILEIPLPDGKGRLDILSKILSKETLDNNIDLSTLAEVTEGFSGSDLKELVRVAAMQRLKTLASEAKKNVTISDLANNKAVYDNYMRAASLCSLRPLNADDFKFAIMKTSKSMSSVTEFNFNQESDDIDKLKAQILRKFMSGIPGADVSKADECSNNNDEAEEECEDEDLDDSMNPPALDPPALD